MFCVVTTFKIFFLQAMSLPEAEVRPDEGERDTDPEPEGQQGHQGEEGDSSRATVVP